MKLKKENFFHTLLHIAFKVLTYCAKFVEKNKLAHETHTRTHAHAKTHTKQAHYSKNMKKHKIRQ